MRSCDSCSRNLLDVLREAASCGKLLSLYQGLATKNGHAVLAGFVYFYSYSYIRSKYLMHAQAEKLGTLANLVVAAAAGACTACATQVSWALPPALVRATLGRKQKGVVYCFC